MESVARKSLFKEDKPMADAAIKPGHFTYGDYCGWPDDERWELIDGVAYPWHLGPAPTRSHQQVLRDLLVQITLVLKGGSCEVYPAPFDVRLSDTDEADEHIQTVLQPDIAVICDQSKLDEDRSDLAKLDEPAETTCSPARGLCTPLTTAG